MIQARDPSLVGRPFFAHFDPDAVWLSDLRPAFADSFPFASAGDGPNQDWGAELLASAD
jgi:hypothetical protein